MLLYGFDGHLILTTCDDVLARSDKLASKSPLFFTHHASQKIDVISFTKKDGCKMHKYDFIENTSSQEWGNHTDIGKKESQPSKL